jgi:2,3,4,5-tetrahydropyridine-2-carboxylate N-succinyltransferase
MSIETKEQFSEFVKTIQSRDGYKNPIGFGICRVDLGQKDTSKILQATYPLPNWKENFGSATVLISALEEVGKTVDFSESESVFRITSDLIAKALEKFTPFLEEDGHKNIDLLKLLQNRDDLDNFRLVFIFADEVLKSVEATYLKLYALSTKKAELRSLNLGGAFGALHNVAWSGNQPIELDWLRENEMQLKVDGEYPEINSVDKFPRFLQHIIPEDNTRILDTSKVRFGARLSAGTTVMPGASYINFNAGTNGVSMVEGRISSSAIVGDGSDVGGGASILGVLSGGNADPISVGEKCLLGANSTTGISLGDGCIVDGGVTILAGTKVLLSETEKEKLQTVNNKTLPEAGIVRCRDLSGFNGLHFRQDSTTGEMKVFRSTREIELNSELHN